VNKNILVTGGAGYIGSHVCQMLKRYGFTPVTYDNLCSGNISAVQWGPLIEGDIRDTELLSETISKYNPIAIMHFAALIQVGESVSNPSLYYNNNVYGSFCLLEQANKHSIKHMVFSSTAAVYGLPDKNFILEDDPKKPINPYGQTKLMMEQMIYDYSKAYGLNYAVLRYFNAAGADPDGKSGTAYKVDTHLIPLLMKVAGNVSENIKIFGTDYQTPDGTAIRDYVHVTDLAEAHILSLKHILSGGDNLVLNIGTNQGLSVNQVVQAARQITGHPIPEVVSERRAGDPSTLVADSTKARQVLNWIPAHSNIEKIISTAWAWKKFQLGKNED
jgi:UDP-arabinose 4-epimerase